MLDAPPPGSHLSESQELMGLLKALCKLGAVLRPGLKERQNRQHDLPYHAWGGARRATPESMGQKAEPHPAGGNQRPGKETHTTVEYANCGHTGWGRDSNPQP